MNIIGFLTLALALAFFYAKRENERKKLDLERAEREKIEKQLAFERAEREKVEKQLALEILEREKAELEEKLETLHNLYDMRGSEMRNSVLEKMGIINKIAIFRRKIDERVGLTHEKMKTMTDDFISFFTIEKMMATINELYPGLADRIKSSFPQAKLLERDICICCMIFCGFENGVIALFVDRKKRTKAVENWKTSIRKQLGIGKYGNIETALKEKITGFS